MWLMTLKERNPMVEGDSELAFWARRELVRLLVEGIVREDKRKSGAPRVRLTHRVDGPEDISWERGGKLCEVSRNSNEVLKSKNAAGR